MFKGQFILIFYKKSEQQENKTKQNKMITQQFILSTVYVCYQTQNVKVKEKKTIKLLLAMNADIKILNKIFYMDPTLNKKTVCHNQVGLIICMQDSFNIRTFINIFHHSNILKVKDLCNYLNFEKHLKN